MAKDTHKIKLPLEGDYAQLSVHCVEENGVVQPKGRGIAKKRNRKLDLLQSSSHTQATGEIPNVSKNTVHIFYCVYAAAISLSCLDTSRSYMHKAGVYMSLADCKHVFGSFKQF